MNVEELLSTAWRAVEQSGVPEHLHEVAFKEAIEYLKGGRPAQQRQGQQQGRDDATGRRGDRRPQDEATPVGPGEFFAAVARESGADIDDLRQVLSFDGEKVAVTEPTRNLGDTRTMQAQAVAILVAGSRHAGLDESVVESKHVRDECTRKNCYDKNFSRHIAKMDGVNLDADKFHLRPRWAKEFTSTLNRIVGKPEE